MKMRMILPIIGMVLLLCSCEQHLLGDASDTPAFLYFDANGGEFANGDAMRIFVGYYEEYRGGYYFALNDWLSRDGYNLLGWNYMKDASSYYKDFDSDVLESRLKNEGILYRNYAFEFGARQEDKSLYPNGYLDFEIFSIKIDTSKE